MFDIKNPMDLVILGMDVSGVRFPDLASFGHQVFHGVDQMEHEDYQQSSTVYLHSVISNAIHQSGLKIENVGVLASSSLSVDEIDRKEYKFFSKDLAQPKDDFASMLTSAADWLRNESVDAVLLLEENPDTHTVAGVVISTLKVAAANKRILAEISGKLEQKTGLEDNSVGMAIQSALETSNLMPQDVGLLLLSDSLEKSVEMKSPQDLCKFFPEKDGLYCAISGGSGGLLSLIKAVWCLQNRAIPGTSDWKSPDDPQPWKDSGFYIPTESRTWFTSAAQPARVAITTHVSQNGQAHALVLHARQPVNGRNETAFGDESFYLVPICGDSPGALLANMEDTCKVLDNQPNLRKVSDEKIRLLQASLQPHQLITCILGHTTAEIRREIDFAAKGIPAAMEKKMDWRTPMGSFFTSLPLAGSGSISFVYPGAFNSYPGIARSLFYLFPSLYDRLEEISTDLGGLINEKSLYPRSMSALDASELDAAEKELAADPLAMLISGSCLAALYTFLLREIFDIHPSSAFGYSLGEISMMFAGGLWTRADETSAALRASPLFRTRLAGPQNAVREFWGLPGAQHPENGEVLFSNFVLMASPEEAAEAIRKESRVYLIQINTPRQVVIAGDPAACQRVIGSLGCNHLQAPFNYALHCDAMQSELNSLKELLSWPIDRQPGMTLYSSATYQAMPIERDSIARQIADGLCHPLDFTRLINRAYADGARIFIELGAGSNCSRWVDETLKDKPHAAFSINRKGLDDHAAVVQLLAKLVCHHVPVNLSSILA